MKWLKKMFGDASGKSGTDGPESDEQAVLIRILAEDVQTDDPITDLASLEDGLQDLLQEHGEVDGHDIDEVEANVYIYGRSAQEIFEIIQPYLSQNVLTDRARVTLRFGPPGSRESVIQIHNDR